MTVKTISIREDQNDWLTQNDKSLSKFVQRKIDEEIDKDVAHRLATTTRVEFIND